MVAEKRTQLEIKHYYKSNLALKWAAIERYCKLYCNDISTDNRFCVALCMKSLPL